MTTVCIGSNCLYGPELGGHTWPYLNWALGAKSNGCGVIWLEGVAARTPPDEVARLLDVLMGNLAVYGLADSVHLCPWDDEPLHAAVAELTPGPDAAAEADVFLDLVYDLPSEVVERFSKSALVNIDPGLLESWIVQGAIRVPEHDLYLTTGARTFDDSRPWELTVPCVSLEEWSLVTEPPGGTFTSVSGWYGNDWFDVNGEHRRNDKRTGYLPFLDVPGLTDQRLELAVDLQDDPEDEAALLRSKGWVVRRAPYVAGSPHMYRAYVRDSMGEFGCCKPSYAKWRTGWISDRTVCYLASGRPAVIQDTGPNPALDGGPGVLRFTTPTEAAACLDRCANDYAEHARGARDLAERLFDARKVVGKVLERIV